MINRIFLAFVFEFLFVSVFSQSIESLKFTPDNLHGVEITRSDVFNENSLWGYINGGADLYLEYGFTEVLVQDFKWEGEPFKVDAYMMNSSEAAFGIFSVSRFNCQKNGLVAQWDCVNPYQVQAAIGNIFLSVVAYNGTEKSMELAVRIANIFIQKIDKPQFEFPRYVPYSNPSVIQSGIKLIAGQLALQNTYTTIEDAFYGVSNYKIWVLPLELNSVDLLLVTFNNAEDREGVLSRIKAVKGFANAEAFKELSNSFYVINSRGKELSANTYSEIVYWLSNW